MFFKHDNQPAPPSLSAIGKLRVGQKSDILQCLWQTTVHKPHEVDVKILDGAAVMNMQTPRLSKTSGDYAERFLLLNIVAQVQDVRRLDVIWDRNHR